MQSSDDLPVVGREQEKARFQTLLEKGHGTMLFHGAAGVGKTTLLQQLHDLARTQSLSSFVDVFDHSDPVMVIRMILDGFQEASSSKDEQQRATLQGLKQSVHSTVQQMTDALQIRQSIVASQGSRISEVTQNVSISDSALQMLRSRILAEVQKLFFSGLKSLAGTSAVCVFIDTLEQATPEINGFVGSLLHHCGQNVIVIVAGRYHTSVLEEQLGPLSASEVTQILGQMNIPVEFHIPISRLCRGNGMCLKLLIFYALHVPRASPAALGAYDPIEDPAALIREFWENLVLTPISELARSSDPNLALHYEKIFALLRYGPSFHYLDVPLIHDVFDEMPELEGLFPDRRTLYKCLEDPVVSVYVRYSRQGPRFDELICEVGDLGLLRKLPYSYASLHRSAAKRYGCSLLGGNGESQAEASHYREYERHMHLYEELEPDVAAFLSLDWRKNPDKQVLLASAWPEITIDRLHDPRQEIWRKTLVAFCHHLLRSSEWTGAFVIDRILEQTLSPTQTSLCAHVLATTWQAPVVSRDLEAWFAYLQALYGYRETVPMLRELVEQARTPERVRLKAAFWLARHYAGKQPSLSEPYLSILERHQQVILAEERATFYREISRILEDAGQSDASVTYLGKAEASSTTAWDRGDSLMKLGIKQRRLGDLAASRRNLAESIQLFMQAEEGDKVGEACIAMGDLCRAEEKVDEAAGWYERAQDILTQTEEDYRVNARAHSHVRALIGISKAARSRVRIAAGDYSGARDDLEKAIEYHRQLGPDGSYSLGWELRLLGQVEEVLGHTEAAADLYRQAAKMAAETRHVIAAKCCLADLLLRQGDSELAATIKADADELIRTLGQGDYTSWLRLTNKEVMQSGDLRS